MDYAEQLDDCVEKILSSETIQGSMLVNILNSSDSLYHKVCSFNSDEDFVLAAYEILKSIMEK